MNRSTFDGFHSDSDTVSKSEEELQLAGNRNNRLTKLQKDIITAVWQAKQPNFDGEREFEDRLRNKQKIVNLVLCVLWREADTGPLHVLNIHNFCSDKETQSADAYFVADVMDFHLQKNSDSHPGTFDAFHKIFLAGDHRSHFSSIQTIFDESKFYEKYGK